MNRFLLAITGVLALSPADLLAQRRDENIILKGKDFQIRRLRTYQARDERVWETVLVYGGINFGGQLDNEEDDPGIGKPGHEKKNLRRLPITYYHPYGPLGRVLDRYNWFRAPLHEFTADARLPAHLAAASLGDESGWSGLIASWSEPPLAVVGMWSGAIAAYARPYQRIDFFERVPEFIELSRPTKGKAIFTYIQDAEERGAIIRIFPGEFRATVSREAAEGFYHVIGVECDKQGGSQPLNEQMMTQEAMTMLVEKLAPRGTICYHTSHRYIDIPGGLVPTGKKVGLAGVVGKDPGADRSVGQYASEWVLLAKDATVFDSLTEPPVKPDRIDPRHRYWNRKPPETPREWRDAHFPLKGLYRGDPELSWLANGSYELEGALRNSIFSSFAEPASNLVREIHRTWDRHSVDILNREKDEKRPAQP